MIGCPKVELPSVVVTEEKNTLVVVLCHLFGEQSLHDGVHLIRVAFKEHANPSLEKTVTSENHRIDPISSIIDRHNEHVVGSSVTGGLKRFDAHFAAK